MATPNIVPRADSEGQLGTSSKYWAAAYIDLIYLGAGKIGRDADNYISFELDNYITINVGGTTELTLNATNLYPQASDGLALGKSDKMWSDLFLASGAVINFDNGNVTLTHANNTLTLADSKSLGFGTSNDMYINHDATNSNITNFTGDLQITNRADDKDIILQSDDGSGGHTPYLTLDGSETRIVVSKAMRFDDSVTLQLGSGADLTMHNDGSNSFVSNNTGNLTFTQNTDDGDIIFKSDDGSGGTTEYLRLDGSSVQTIVTKNFRYIDNAKAIFGTGEDLQIYHDGSSSYIENGDGNMFIMQRANDADLVFQADNGAGADATYFYLDGSSAEHDGSATTALYTNWPDKSRISLGTSHDLRIYHDGSNSYIQASGTGDIIVEQRNDDKDIVFQSDDGSGGVTEYFRLDGSNATHDGSATTGLFTNWPDKSRISLGTGHDLQLYHTGTDSNIANYVGDFYIQNQADDKDIIFKCDDGSGGVATYFTVDGGAVRTNFAKELRMLDNVKFKAGTSGDLEIFHDGSHSYIIENGTGNLWIGSNGGAIYLGDEGANETFLKATDNGNVELYYDNVKKLETKSDGVDITGELQCDTLDVDGNADILGVLNFSKTNVDAESSENFYRIKFNDVGGVHNDVGIGQNASNNLGFNITAGGNFTFNNGTSGNMLTLTGSVSTFKSPLTVGVDDTGHDVTFFGATSGKKMLYDASEDSLKIHTNAGSVGLGIFTSAESTAPNLIVGRSDNEYWGVMIGDRDARLVHRQDETDSQAMFTKFELWSSGTGNDQWQWNSASNSGSSVVNAMTLDKAGKLSTGVVKSTSATGTASGAGINTSGTVAIDVGEINGEIITTIKVDLGTGDIRSSSTAGDVIGEDDTEGAFITRITTAVNGIVYRGEMICVEVPVTGDPDINLTANTSATLAEDGAGEAQHVLIDGGTATLAKHYPSITVPSGGIQDDYLYLTHGGTTAGTYARGQFIIKLYGAAVVS